MLAVVTCARLRVVILLFQPQEQSTMVLAALLLQDCPCGTPSTATQLPPSILVQSQYEN